MRADLNFDAGTQTAFKRSDGALPKGARTDGVSSLRTKLLRGSPSSLEEHVRSMDSIEVAREDRVACAEVDVVLTREGAVAVRPPDIRIAAAFVQAAPVVGSVPDGPPSGWRTPKKCPSSWAMCVVAYRPAESEFMILLLTSTELRPDSGNWL